MSLKAALLAAKRRLKMQAGGVATDTFDPVPEEDPAAVKRGQRFLSGVGLGIPREPVRNASGDVVFPTNAIERALTQSDIAAKQYAAAFMGPGKTPGVRPRLYLTAGRDYDIPSTVLTKDLPRPEGAMEALRRPASPPQRQIDVPDPYAKPLERPAPKPMSEADWEKEWQDFAGEYGHTDEEMEAKYWELRDAQRDAERQRALDEPKYQTPPWPDMPRGRAARVREAVKRSTGRQQGGGVDEPGQDIHDLDPQEVATWERTSGPLGSNPGGMHEAPDGSQHYVKAYPGLVGHDRTLNEQLTNQLYKAAGVPVADTKVTRWRNGTALSSQIVEGKKLSRFEPSEYPKIKDLLEHFPADAWLANYDVAGTHHNNIIVDDDDRAWRIDNGGGLRYRATGKPKEHWDEDSSKELEGLQSKEHNKWTAKLFKDVRVSKDDQSYVGALRVSRVPDETIERLVNRYGPGIDKDKDQISDIIKARRDNIAKAYGIKKRKYQEGGGIEGIPDPIPPEDPEAMARATSVLGPSWAERAQQQTSKDIAAYQQSGVPGLMADTGETADLAGGFVGQTTPRALRPPTNLMSLNRTHSLDDVLGIIRNHTLEDALMNQTVTLRQAENINRLLERDPEGLAHYLGRNPNPNVTSWMSTSLTGRVADIVRDVYPPVDRPRMTGAGQAPNPEWYERGRTSLPEDPALAAGWGTPPTRPPRPTTPLMPSEALANAPSEHAAAHLMEQLGGNAESINSVLGNMAEEGFAGEAHHIYKELPQGIRDEIDGIHHAETKQPAQELDVDEPPTTQPTPYQWAIDQRQWLPAGGLSRGTQDFLHNNVLPHYDGDFKKFADSYLANMYDPANATMIAGPDYLNVTSSFYIPKGGGGSIDRTIKFGSTPEGRYAYHSFLRVPLNSQASGIAKNLLANQVDLYRKMDLSYVKTHADIDIGSYAWGKYGFLPAGDYEWNSLASMLGRRLTNYTQLRRIPEDTAARFRNILSQRDRHALWDFVDSQAKLPTEMQTAKKTKWSQELLIGTGWSARLDLRDPASMRRFDAYVGPPR